MQISMACETQKKTEINQRLSSIGVIECLEENIWKQIYCKRPSSTKQMKRFQKIQVEICKYKHNHVGICSFWFH